MTSWCVPHLLDPTFNTQHSLCCCCINPTHRAGDFAVIVKTLQRYPAVDVDAILRAAARLPACATVLGTPV
jgi:hypothetical protein